jgi:hypothetical protein
MEINLALCPPGSDDAWVYEYTLEEGLAEVDFFFRQRLLYDAKEMLDALSVRFPEHLEIERRMTVLVIWVHRYAARAALKESRRRRARGTARRVAA